MVATTPEPTAACQTITVSFCKDMPYTQTILPNILGHKNQDDASLEVHTFAPLIHAECSPDMKPFLCSVYTPECVSGTPRPPCRRLCEKARAGCEPLLKQFGFQWPEGLRCEAFTTESCQYVSPKLAKVKTVLLRNACKPGRDLLEGSTDPWNPGSGGL